MKNILAENFLRFAPKNLNESTRNKLEQLAEQEESGRSVGNVSLMIPKSFPRVGTANGGMTLLNKSDNQIALFFGRSTANKKVQGPWAEIPGAQNMQLGNSEHGYGLIGKCPIGLLENKTYVVYGTEVTGDVASPSTTNKTLGFAFGLVGDDLNYMKSNITASHYFDGTFKNACAGVISLGLVNDSLRGDFLMSLIRNGKVAAPWESGEFDKKFLANNTIRNMGEIRAISPRTIQSVANA